MGLGGVLNSASVAAALGVPVMLLHPAGEGVTDAAVAATTARLGIRTRTWPSRPDPFVSLVFSDPGDRGFLSASDLACLRACPAIPPATWVHVGGLIEASAFPARIAEVRAAGARVAVSGCWAPELLAILAREVGRPWDLLVLNRKEAELAAGPRATPTDFTGAATDVVITNGPKGADAWIDDCAFHVPAVPTRVVDSTGAGDALMGGVLAGRLFGLGPEAALRLGVEVASRVLTIHGGVVLDPRLLAGLRPGRVD